MYIYGHNEVHKHTHYACTRGGVGWEGYYHSNQLSWLRKQNGRYALSDLECINYKHFSKIYVQFLNKRWQTVYFEAIYAC